MYRQLLDFNNDQPASLSLLTVALAKPSADAIYNDLRQDNRIDSSVKNPPV